MPLPPPPAPCQGRQSRGFSLVEMSIVLVIIGLIIGATFPLLRGMLQTQRSIASKKELETAKQALIAFAITRGRLPRQDVSAGADVLGNGVEEATYQTCTDTNYCKLPYMTLQVKGTDNYSLPLLYDVSRELTVSPGAGGICEALKIISGEEEGLDGSAAQCGEYLKERPCITRDGDVDNGSVQILGSTGYRVAAIVVSRGENRLLDGKNSTGSNREFEMETKARTGDYDDIVVTLTYGELISALNCGEKEDP